MEATIKYIHHELEGIFPPEEIRSLGRLLLEAYTGWDYTAQLLHRKDLLTATQVSQIKKAIFRIKKHEPIQYILGVTEFMGFPIQVNPSVLIPRQETEELISWIVEEEGDEVKYILDIGTGSGCIPIALSKLLPGSKVQSVDVSREALEIARQNCMINECNIDLLSRDVLTWGDYAWGDFDLIVSNPPYVRNLEKRFMKQNVLEYEPELALFVDDEQPLLFYDVIASLAREHLRPGGALFFEINEYLGEEMVNLLNSKGFCDVLVRQDLNGKDRMLRCKQK